MAAQGTRATEILRRAGIAHVIVPYEPAESSGRARAVRPSYGKDAAAAIGIAPKRVCKTLVARADDQLVLAVLPVSRQLDLKRLAIAVGARRAELAEPAVAEQATGYVVGGISPLGTRRRLRTVIDSSVLTLPSIHVSAGRRGLQVELAPADLVRLTDATAATIGSNG